VAFESSNYALHRAVETSRVVSMTAPPQTNAQGLDTSKVPVTEDTFFRLIESDMTKVEDFTLAQVTNIRKKIASVEESLKKRDSNTFDPESVMQQADEVAEDFLRLEKYVNLNFMGFHKVRSFLSFTIFAYRSLNDATKSDLCHCSFRIHSLH
jgi:hypothetical protein